MEMVPNRSILASNTRSSTKKDPGQEEKGVSVGFFDEEQRQHLLPYGSVWPKTQAFLEHA